MNPETSSVNGKNRKVDILAKSTTSRVPRLLGIPAPQFSLLMFYRDRPVNVANLPSQFGTSTKRANGRGIATGCTMRQNLTTTIAATIIGIHGHFPIESGKALRSLNLHR
jgi:hypothetical protein